MRMCVYRSAARRPLQMERLAQTLLCCVAVRYDCFYQRRVPTTVGQWVAKLANGTNGAARRGPTLDGVTLGFYALRIKRKERVPEPPHASEGMQRRLATHDCHFKEPASAGKLAHLCAWSGHKPTSAKKQEELRAATITNYQNESRWRGSRAAAGGIRHASPIRHSSRSSDPRQGAAAPPPHES
jgi:hypothetical protein